MLPPSHLQLLAEAGPPRRLPAAAAAAGRAPARAPGAGAGLAASAAAAVLASRRRAGAPAAPQRRPPPLSRPRAARARIGAATRSGRRPVVPGRGGDRPARLPLDSSTAGRLSRRRHLPGYLRGRGGARAGLARRSANRRQVRSPRGGGAERAGRSPRATGT